MTHEKNTIYPINDCSVYRRRVNSCFIYLFFRALYNSIMKKTFNGDYKFRGYKIKQVEERYSVYDSSGEFVFSVKTLKEAQNQISKLANQLKKARI